MDIELPEMKGVEASAKMREVENEYENIHTNIIAVTVAATVESSGVIDSICKILNNFQLKNQLISQDSNNTSSNISRKREQR
jgi:CheY-like chemotaxis protein